MFSLNAIGLEKKILNGIVQSEKKIFCHFNFLIFQFIREPIKIPKRFWHHSMCFQIMHTASKFQFFIHIFIVVKLKNKIQNVKRGEKWGEKSVFSQYYCLIVWHRVHGISEHRISRFSDIFRWYCPSFLRRALGLRRLVKCFFKL